jgi:hypothetical protein
MSGAVTPTLICVCGLQKTMLLFLYLNTFRALIIMLWNTEREVNIILHKMMFEKYQLSDVNTTVTLMEGKQSLGVVQQP